MLVYFWLTLYFYASPPVIVNLLAKYRKLLLESFSLFSCMQLQHFYTRKLHLLVPQSEPKF